MEAAPLLLPRAVPRTTWSKGGAVRGWWPRTVACSAAEGRLYPSGEIQECCRVASGDLLPGLRGEFVGERVDEVTRSRGFTDAGRLLGVLEFHDEAVLDALIELKSANRHDHVGNGGGRIDEGTEGQVCSPVSEPQCLPDSRWVRTRVKEGISSRIGVADWPWPDPARPGRAKDDRVLRSGCDRDGAGQDKTAERRRKRNWRSGDECSENHAVRLPAGRPLDLDRQVALARE